MDKASLKQLLELVRSGDVPIDSALDRLKHMPFEDLGFAKVDHHRALRHGMPEVVFGKGKRPDYSRGYSRIRNHAQPLSRG